MRMDSPAATDSRRDQRLKLLEVTMKRHQFQHGALIEVLHHAQELFGYLDRDVLYFVARRLKLPPSKVYGVATFYHFFSLKPQGKHICVVCLGTACYVKGAGAILGAVEDWAGLNAGQTTRNGEVSLLTARCIGACGIAPATVLDGKVRGHETPDRLLADMKGWGPRGPV
jgi:bidirectional [NiFe] hydrogenase diaphorase subunit